MHVIELRYEVKIMLKIFILPNMLKFGLYDAG